MSDAIENKLVQIDTRAVDAKVKDFSELLDQIQRVSDKKRQLWREIYENAISDRQNAYLMFSTLVKIVQEKSTEHAVHGKTIATYIEKMSRANDQLLKLSELIEKADVPEEEEDLDPETVFAKIAKK